MGVLMFTFGAGVMFALLSLVGYRQQAKGGAQVRVGSLVSIKGELTVKKPKD